MRRAGWQVIGLPEYTFARVNGRTLPVSVDITIRMPVGDATKATVEAAVAARAAAIVGAAKAGKPQKALAREWGLTQSQVSRILSGNPGGRPRDARRISSRLRKGR